MATAPTRTRTIDLPVAGMDCASCAAHVETAVRGLPGVDDVRVLLSAERATVSFDPEKVDRGRIVAAIGAAGYSVPESPAAGEAAPPAAPASATRAVGWGVLGLVAAVVLLAALAERFGVLEGAAARLPWWVPATTRPRSRRRRGRGPGDDAAEIRRRYGRCGSGRRQLAAGHETAYNSSIAIRAFSRQMRGSQTFSPIETPSQDRNLVRYGVIDRASKDRGS